jgi:hypothetical protein
VIVGLLLTLGIRSILTLRLVASLLLALTVGKAVVQDTQTVADNLVYVLIVYVLLVNADHDLWTIERLWQAWRNSEVTPSSKH